MHWRIKWNVFFGYNHVDKLAGHLSSISSRLFVHSCIQSHEPGLFQARPVSGVAGVSKTDMCEMNLSGMLLLESMCEEWISICMRLHVIWIRLIHSVAKMESCFFFLAVGFIAPSSGGFGGLCSWWHASPPYLLHRRWTALIPRDRCMLPSGAMDWGGCHFFFISPLYGREDDMTVTAVV